MPTCPGCRGTKKTRQIGMMNADCVICDATGSVTKDVWEKEIEERRVPTEMIQPKFDVDYKQQEANAMRNKMHNANVAYLNQPISLNKQIQNSPAHDRLTDAELNRLKSQVKPREDDMLASQREVIATEDVADVTPVAKPKAKKSEAK